MGELKSIVNEISHKGQLKEFENILEEIIKTILNSNCNISCSDIHEISSIEQSREGSFKSHIRIGFKRKKEKSIHFIWDILHEYGHFLSGLPNTKEGILERENLAWNLALEELKKISELFIYLDDFNAYKEACLMTYKRNIEE